MRKLIYVVLVLAFISCGKSEWNRESLAAKCKKNMSNDKNMKVAMTPEQQAQVCDCTADKVMGKYKTKAEADKDVAGVDELGNECATSILMPSVPEDTSGATPVDTTAHPDSTGNNQ